MSFEIEWRVQVIDTAARFLKDDPAGLTQVFHAVGLLAHEPRPPGSTELGSQYLRRVHVGRYRIIYEIFESKVTIVVMHLGRVG